VRENEYHHHEEEDTQQKKTIEEERKKIHSSKKKKINLTVGSQPKKERTVKERKRRCEIVSGRPVEGGSKSRLTLGHPTRLGRRLLSDSTASETTQIATSRRWACL
jgi:hypothetical protein